MADSIRLNHAALAAILKSDVVEALEALGEQAKNATSHPDEHEVETWVGRNRARVSVKPSTFAQRARENRDHELVRALGVIQGSGG